MATAVVERDRKMRSYVMSEQTKREIQSALPEHIPVERFQRVLMTSVVHDNRLANADPLKVIRAALKIAPLGLLTDPLLGEAYLIADGSGDVQARVGYRGYIKLARQSGQVASIYAHEVRENDEVECDLGVEKYLRHKPNLFGERGKVIGYYAVVKFTNGESDFEPMTIADIHRIRDRSDAWKAYKGGKIKSTPWATDEEEMAKKTVLRRLLKRVPMSPDLADALRADDSAEEAGEDRRIVRDITPAGPPASLDDFANGADEGHDPETGVVDEDPPAAEAKPQIPAEPTPADEPALPLDRPAAVAGFRVRFRDGAASRTFPTADLAVDELCRLAEGWDFEEIDQAQKANDALLNAASDEMARRFVGIRTGKAPGGKGKKG